MQEDYSRPTTALRKIAGLKKRVRVVQGGQGASKTISLLQLIINHCSSKEGREVIIGSEQLTKMRLTVIKDFVKVMRSFGIYNPRSFKAETFYRFPNGSFIKFVGLDKEDVGKGLRSHIFYLNEANKVNFETYRELASRAQLVLMDFNPNTRFWVHEEVLQDDDAELLILTHEDNEYLPDPERNEILKYYEKGYDEEGNIINAYWSNKWRVYGLGLDGRLDGAVFERWEVIEEIPEQARLMGYGIDFGYANPAAITACYLFNGEWIFDEIAYSSGKGNAWLARKVEEYGADNEIGYADSAEPKSIAKLQGEGLNVHPCDNKSDIRDYAIDELNERPFYFTSRSTNLIEEANGYIWDTDKNGTPTGRPVKKKDHGMDSIIYFVGSFGKYDGSYFINE